MVMVETSGAFLLQQAAADCLRTVFGHAYFRGYTVRNSFFVAAFCGDHGGGIAEVFGEGMEPARGVFYGGGAVRGDSAVGWSDTDDHRCVVGFVLDAGDGDGLARDQNGFDVRVGCHRHFCLWRIAGKIRRAFSVGFFFAFRGFVRARAVSQTGLIRGVRDQPVGLSARGDLESTT